MGTERGVSLRQEARSRAEQKRFIFVCVLSRVLRMSKDDNIVISMQERFFKPLRFNWEVEGLDDACKRQEKIHITP